MPTINLRWDNNNVIEEGYHIYRSDSFIDINNPPTPIDTVGRDVVRYHDDDSNLIEGKTYFYTVGAYINSTVLFSNVIEFIPSDNTAYVTTTDNKVIKFRSGGIVWENTLTDSIGSILVADDNKVYVSTNTTNMVYEFDANTGSETYQYNCHQPVIDITTNVKQDKLLFATSGGYILVQKRPSMFHDSTIVVSTENRNTRYVSANDDFIYAGDHSNGVYQYTYDGTRQWSFTPSDVIYGGVEAVTDGVIVGHGSTVSKLAGNGNEVWSNSFSGTVRGVSTDRYGNVYAFSDTVLKRISNDGKEDWAYQTSNNIKSVDTEITGSLFAVQNNDVTIYANDSTVIGGIATVDTIDKISMTRRSRLPEVFTPLAHGSYMLGNEDVGQTEHSGSTASIAGLEFVVSSTGSDTGNVVEHGASTTVNGLGFTVSSTGTVV